MNKYISLNKIRNFVLAPRILRMLKNKYLIIALLCLGMANLSFRVFAAEPVSTSDPKTSESGKADEKREQRPAQMNDSQKDANADTEPVRRFNDVLFDILNEFSYELKTGVVPKLTNVSLRRVAIGENIPKTYESYVESLVSEKFQRFSKIRILQCPSCRVKHSVVENGRIRITTPINNPKELDFIADQIGIETWLDVALVYQSTSMALAFNAFDAKTKELVWSKVYNSETIYQKIVNTSPDSAGLNPDDPRKKPEEKKSNYHIAIGLAYASAPNVDGLTDMLEITFTGVERFNNGRSEVGALIVPLIDPKLFLKNYKEVEGNTTVTPTSPDVVVDEKTQKYTVKPYRYGLGVYALYRQNYFAGEENFDQFRIYTPIGGGLLISVGYLTISAKAGIGIKFGRHFFIEGGVFYASPTEISINDKITYKSKGGTGGDLVFGLYF